MANRPSTSRARGVCKYYKQGTGTGCLHGDLCKFLHGDGETLSPYDKSKVCKFYAAGFCKRGEKCWFRHAGSVSAATMFESTEDNAQPSTSSSTGPEEEDSICCICQEKPITYGLLTGCSHICCLQCIRDWRDSSNKPHDIVSSGNTKKCPYCRASSRFITPSSVFYAEEDPRKAEAIEKYKASMARVPCKYFERSRPGKRFCPFGSDCFYRHQEADGSSFIFPHGASHYLNREREIGSSFTDNSPFARFDDGPADFLRTLTGIRTRLESLSVGQSINRQGDNESGDSFIGRLIEGVIAGLESVIAGPEDEERSPLPTSSILASSEDAPLQSISALPLTRAFLDMHHRGESAQAARERLRAASRSRNVTSRTWLQGGRLFLQSESDSSSYISDTTSDSESDNTLDELRLLRSAGHTPPPGLLRSRHAMDYLEEDLTDEDEEDILIQTAFTSRTASPYRSGAPLGFRFSEPSISSEREGGVTMASTPDLLSRTPPFDRFIRPLSPDVDLHAEGTGAPHEHVGPGGEVDNTLISDNPLLINATTTPSTNPNDTTGNEATLNAAQNEEPREPTATTRTETERPKEFRRMKSHTGISRSGTGLTSADRDNGRRRPTSQSFVTDGRGRVVATDDGVENPLSAWFLPSTPLAVVPSEPASGEGCP